MTRPRRLAIPAGLLELIGVLEGVEILRQRRHGSARSLVTSESDLDPASVRLLALTWWPAGIGALAVAWALPLGEPRRGELPGQDGVDGRRVGNLPAGAAVTAAGVAATAAGIALRQWSIATLGRYFTGHVEIQPHQTAISAGPYRWLRHPAYAGQWLEMIGVGLATGKPLSVAICATVPLIGITRRIAGEERELTAGLPGYRDYIDGKARLVPFVW